MGNPSYVNGFTVTPHEHLLDAPRKWRQPKKIFVNSMSDLFHEEIPEEFIQRVFQTMRECPQHTFQILTKRSERLAELAPKLHWAPNIWMGVSVEDNRVIGRAHDLVDVPAAVRFLSCEPLIGAVEGIPEGIDWVIVGGESGPGSRPIEKHWVESLLAESRAIGAAFFFKQWGGVRKHLTGRSLNGVEYLEWPQPKARFGAKEVAA
jgi:protein gp37